MKDCELGLFFVFFTNSQNLFHVSNDENDKKEEKRRG